MAASKLPPNAMSLTRFMLRQQVITLYRDSMKTAKMVKSTTQRKQLSDWIRIEFKNNSHYTDEHVIRMLLTNGKRSLQELKSTLKRLE